ncbi:MAG: hypothetical protein QMD03_06950 [Syntrophales bacterium]|nr:hypothetical protein [Syntrophales bacterium]
MRMGLLKKRKGVVCFMTLALLSGFVSAVSAGETNIVEIGNDVTIEEGIRVRNAVAIGGQVTVFGVVERHVVAIGGSVVLMKTAVVGGNVVSLGGVIVRGRGAEVRGHLIELNLSDISAAISTALNKNWEGWSWIFAIISLSFFLAILILALLIARLFPVPIHVVSLSIRENTFNVTLAGLLVLVSIVPLALLLAVSVVGIILIPLEMLLVVCAALVGFIAVARLVGGKMLTILKIHDKGLVQETLWGLVILWLIGWLPYLGWMVKVIAIVLGMGGVLITRFGTMQSRPLIPDPCPLISPSFSSH